jgi:hypothetical protein
MAVPKQMSEDRIGGQMSAPQEVEGLAEAARGGNRMRPKTKPRNTAADRKMTEKQRPRWSASKPIV